jgi:hypothetical protein
MTTSLPHRIAAAVSSVFVVIVSVATVLAPPASAASREPSRVACAYGKEIFRRIPAYWGPGLGETDDWHFSLCYPGEDRGRVLRGGVVEPRYRTLWYLVEFDGPFQGRRTGWVTDDGLVWLDLLPGATVSARTGT